MKSKVIQPEGWAPPKGYANGVLGEDGTLYVAGQVGWSADQVFVEHSFIGQMEQALLNILAIVEAAGGTVDDLVRLTWFVKGKQEYLANQREVGVVYRRVLGRNFPAMSLVVISDLIEEGALLEIEATAFLGCK